MGNQYTSGTHDIEYRTEKMKKYLHANYPEFEYVSGFHHCDGKIVVRYKGCGHTREVSLISVRHKTLTRAECLQCKHENEQEQKHKRIEYEKFKRNVQPMKVVQTEFKECSSCGEMFFTTNTRAKFCSVECAKKATNEFFNRKKEFRKRISKTSESNSITLSKLFKRDKGICWICGKPCDYSLSGNDNYYPSIDHVIPIAKGGKDKWDNVRLAHRICNSLKNDSLDYAPANI